MKQILKYFSKTWLRSGLVTAFAVSFSFGLQAQTAPAIQWDRTFGGNDGDYFFELQQTTDGGYILGGWSGSNISGDKSQNSRMFDFWIIKTDVNGNKVWDKSIGGFDSDILHSIQQTSDGGYITGGYSSSGWDGDKSEVNRGGPDYWIVKLNPNGGKTWDKTFGGTDDDRLAVIRQTTDGGYILGGSSRSGLNGDKTEASKGRADFWIIKINSTGTKIWDKSIGGSEDDYLTNILQTTDGGFIAIGRSSSGISGDKSESHRGGHDFWIVKLDANGNKLWDKTYGGNQDDQPSSIIQTMDGGYMVGGTSSTNISGDKSSPSNGSYDVWIIKLDSTGSKQWDKSLGGSLGEGLGSIQQTPDGGYILGAGSDSGISGDKSTGSKGLKDYWVLKVDGNGNKLWDKTIGGSNNDHLGCLKKTSDGGFIIGGHSYSNISGDKTHNSIGIFDYWIVKLGPEIVGLKEPAITFNLTISPNPNQGKFKLQLNDLKTLTAEVTVTDLLGRVVLQKELSVTDQQVSEELTLTAAKGMYVLQVKAGEEVTSRKIVVE